YRQGGSGRPDRRLDRNLRGRRQALTSLISRRDRPASQLPAASEACPREAGLMSISVIDRAAAATPPGIARKFRGLSDRAIAWIFVAPAIFLLLAVNIFPLIWTIRLSFTNYAANRPNREVEWVGLRNYERIL